MLDRATDPPHTNNLTRGLGSFLFFLSMSLTALGLSCSTGDLQSPWTPSCAPWGQFPDQGANPGPLHWECGVWTSRGVPRGAPSGSFPVPIRSRQCQMRSPRTSVRALQRDSHFQVSTFPPSLQTEPARQGMQLSTTPPHPHSGWKEVSLGEICRKHRGP